MPDFPVIRNINPVVISPASPEVFGEAFNGMGYAPSASAWPTSNKAIFVPFSVYSPITVVKMFVENGGTVSGNIDVGIYDRGGVRLVSSGSTAQSGASATQEFNITDTTLKPGLYFLAVAMDNTTGQLLRFSTSGGMSRGMGCAEQATAFALPSTATLASMSSSYIPFIAATLRPTI